MMMILLVVVFPLNPFWFHPHGPWLIVIDLCQKNGHFQALWYTEIRSVINLEIGDQLDLIIKWSMIYKNTSLPFFKVYIGFSSGFA